MHTEKQQRVKMEPNDHHPDAEVGIADNSCAVTVSNPLESSKHPQQTKISPREFGDDLHPKETRLFELVKNGTPQQVKDFLKENFINKGLSTPSAISDPSTSTDGDQANDISVADSLDLNKKDAEFHSVLQVAVFRGNVEIVKHLLDAGCSDPCAVDLAGALRSNGILELFLSKIHTDTSHSEEADGCDEANSPHNVAENDGSNAEAEESDDKKTSTAVKLRNGVNRLSRKLKGKAIPPDSRDETPEMPNENLNDIKRMLKAAIDSEDYVKTKMLATILEKRFRYVIDPTCNCNCPQHRGMRKNGRNSQDVLQDSQARLEDCHISSSPCYILATAEDPIGFALKANKHLQSMAYWHPENREEFLQLAKRSSRLAVDLLETCQNDGEAKLLFKVGLNCEQSTTSPTTANAFKYKLLHDAVGLLQKEFVSQPTCQLEVSKLWYGPYYASWAEWSAPRRICHVALQAMLTPFIFIMFACRGKKGIRKYAKDCLKAPFNRFIYSATSYIFFIVTVVSKQYVDREKNWPIPSVDGYDFIIGLWLVGYICKLVTDFVSVQHMSYSRLWWVTYDATMMILFALGMLTYILGFGVEDANWRAALLSQGFYSIAITFSCMRTLQWLHLSSTLGPLVISFSEMAVVIKRLLVIFAIVVVSFSAGIFTVYKNFHTDDPVDEREDNFFRTYIKTLKILFWALFGRGDANIASIPDNYRYVFGNVTVTSELQQSFTVIVGYILWAFFHIAVVLVLLNMLVAVMTNYYQIIQDNGDTEWKFARTKLRMYYIEKRNMFPPPFNLLHIVCQLVIRHLPTKWKCQRETGDQPDSPENGVKEPDKEEHQKILKDLIKRYLHRKDLDESRAKVTGLTNFQAPNQS